MSRLVALAVLVLCAGSSFGALALGAGAPEEGASGRAVITIHDVYELQNMSKDLDADYELANDIDAWGTHSWNDGNGFEPVGNGSAPFTGTLDGKGYSISVLVIGLTDREDVGLFGETGAGSRISNLTLGNYNISGKRIVGGLVGKNFGMIENCGWDVGFGLRGWEPEPYACIGGLVGWNEGTLRGCFASGWGWGYGELFGGLVGLNERGGSMIDCTVRADIKGGYDVGGLAGNNSGLLSGCTNTGAVKGEGSVGGLVAQNGGGTIANCSNTGNVSGDSDVGGIAAYSVGKITGCINTGNVTSVANNFTGGILAYNWKGLVSRCYNTGTIAGADVTGGVVGANLGDISRCYNTGPVSGTNNVGGVAGRNANEGGYMGVMADCYNIGSVSGTSEVGGLVGALAKWEEEHSPGGISYGCNISRSYNAGVVSGTADAGGFVGSSTRGSTYDCYWDTETSGYAASVCGTGKSTAEMKKQATFAGWDFTNVWKINEDVTYPYLRDMPQPSENRAPTIITSPPTTATVATPLSVQFIAIDPDGDALTWSMTSNASWLSMTAGGLLSGTPAEGDIGSSIAAVSVSDGRGGTASITFELAVREKDHFLSWGRMPVDATLNAGDNYKAMAGADDSFEGHVVTYAIASDPPCGLVINATSGEIRWKDIPSPGSSANASQTYVFNLTATDGDILIRYRFRLTVVANPAPPVNREPAIVSLSAPENVTFKATEALTFAVEATDPDGDNLTYRWEEDGKVISTERSFSRAFPPGNHTLILLISDGRYVTTRTFNFSVAQPPRTIEVRPPSVPGFELGMAAAAIALAAVSGLFWRRERR